MDYLIVVAGGKGLRMGGDTPKQFQLIGGLPILMHTLNRLHEAVPDARLILVLPKEQQNYWQELCAQYSFRIPYVLADGGMSRFHSVKNGLDKVPSNDSGVVGVHDGVRPFVSLDVVRNCFALSRTGKAVVPASPIVETVRHLVNGKSKTVNRNNYKLVQTPQTFPLQMLKQAYAQPYTEDFTDDASVVEAMGIEVNLVEGNRENIKITTPFDKAVGEMLVLTQHHV